MKNLEYSKFLLLESNYDLNTLKCSSYPYPLKQRIAGPYGHLSNDIAGQTISHLMNYGLETVMLGHLSKENNFPELAYQTVLNELNSSSSKVPFHLSVAGRDSIDEVIQI